MAKHGKKYTAVKKKVQVEKLYSVEEALQFIKNNPTAKFDETVEVALRMGVDPTKSDQAIRSTVALPNGSGKDVRVIVFATGSAAEAARAAGAVEAGFEDLLAKVTGGWMDFDIVVSTPDAMKEVRKLGKVLGPRGLMPNPKTGTVTDDTATAVKQFKAGRVEFRMDKNGNIIVPFGKLSFAVEALAENFRAVYDAILASKPASTKGIYIKRCTVSSTMGPGLHLDVKDSAAA
ncbi:MAG: 50S ribosomal protein L1 [Kiritimatiellales bacterium]|jgi:large subunit ribosomal protein L1